MNQADKRNKTILIEIGISTQFEEWAAHEEALRPLISDAIHGAVEHTDIYPEIAERSAEVSLLLCDDAFIRDLNRQHRGKDKPTNVLSYAQTDFYEDIPAYDPLPFGDIILAYETIVREAKEQGKSFEDHFTHLVVHGTLHLLGYDHETEDEAEEMESIEIAVLKEMGIENPYSEATFMA